MSVNASRVLLALVLLTGASLADDELETVAPAEPARDDRAKHRASIDDAVKLLVESSDWREVNAVQKRLGELGRGVYADRVVGELRRPAKSHDDANVRKRWHEVLTTHFGENERARQYVAEHGLRDEDDGVLYHCAWHVGDLKIYGAHRRLRRLMDDVARSDSVRNAATKSLAQLGETDVIARLVKMMESDWFMPRHMAAIGAEALTGRSPSSFGDYQYGEGAFVSGGVEARLMNPYLVDVHENIARRHQAIAAFCRWLEEEQPAVFKHLYAPY